MNKKNKTKKKDRKKVRFEKEKKQRIYKITAIFVFLLCILGVAGFWYYMQHSVKENEVVVTVDGYGITAQELSMHMTKNKSYAVTKYSKEASGTVDKEFWNKEINGTTPEKYLRKYALDELIRYKEEQKLAVSAGLMKKEETSYEVFLGNMKKENENRAKKIAEGEVVYGVKKYTEDSYFSYIYSNMSLQLQEILFQEKQPLFMTDEEIRNWYEQNKEKKYRTIDKYEFECYQPNEDMINSQNMEKVIARLEEVRERLEMGASGDEIKKGFPDILFKKQKLNQENAKELQKLSQSVYDSAIDMEKGEISEVLGQDNISVCMVLKCTSRETGGYMDFETYKDAIKKECISEKYKQYVDELVKKAKVMKTEKYSLVCAK